MDKKLIAALSGASALALLSGGANAAPQAGTLDRLQPARSFSELLDPIPNATAILTAEDSHGQDPDARIELAQFYHHHHHHHQRYFYHHHHHHHFPRFFQRYDHHHHHHHYNMRRYQDD